ncbi:MAG: hypothetical protein N3A72_09110 [bacterium]|nr:hypothetical protein [bacterium]
MGQSNNILVVATNQNIYHWKAVNVVTREYPINLDASGYRAIYLEMDQPETIQLVDFDNEIWEYQKTDLEPQKSVIIPFTAFKLIGNVKNKHLDTSDLKSIRIIKPDQVYSPVIIKKLGFTDSLGIFGPTISIDPLFEFYKPKSWHEWAKDIKSFGFTAVRLVIVTDIPIATQLEIVTAFHQEGLGCVLQIFPTTDFAAYEQHPEWRQRLLSGGSKYDWRVYLCPNHSEFVKFMCARIERTLRRVPYDGIQLAEPWFEVWGGPYEDNPAKGGYACLCDSCVKEFRRFTGVNPRDMFDEKNKYYFTKPDNRNLYEQWIEFRIDTITAFSKKLFDTAKQARPGIKTFGMYLSDCRIKLDAVREYQAQDLEKIIDVVQPDAITIQDAWQDWTQPDLKPDFILAYANAYVSRIRNRAKYPIIIQTHADMGSRKETKRDYQWLRQFSAYSRLGGFDAPSYYEYSVANLK